MYVENLPVRKFHGIGPVTMPGWSGWEFEKGGDLMRSRSRFSRNTSARRGLTTSGLAGSTTARSAPIAFASQSRGEHLHDRSLHIRGGPRGD